MRKFELFVGWVVDQQACAEMRVDCLSAIDSSSSWSRSLVVVLVIFIVAPQRGFTRPSLVVLILG